MKTVSRDKQAESGLCALERALIAPALLALLVGLAITSFIHGGKPSAAQERVPATAAPSTLTVPLFIPWELRGVEPLRLRLSGVRLESRRRCCGFRTPGRPARSADDPDVRVHATHGITRTARSGHHDSTPATRWSAAATRRKHRMRLIASRTLNDGDLAMTPAACLAHVCERNRSLSPDRVADWVFSPSSSWHCSWLRSPTSTLSHRSRREPKSSGLRASLQAMASGGEHGRVASWHRAPATPTCDGLTIRSFRMRRARRNCEAGWYELACQDYFAVAAGHQATRHRPSYSLARRLQKPPRSRIDGDVN